MKKYKFGFCSWYTPFPGPFSLTFAGEAGYDGIQISDLGGHEQGYPLTNKRIQRGFLETAKASNLEIQMINLLTPGLSGMMKHPQESCHGKLAVENISNGIKACAEMKVPNVFIPSIFAGRIDNDFELEMVALYMKVAGSIAKENGVELLYESFMSVEKTMDLYERAGKCFKLCYDTLNPYKYGFGNAVEELKRYDLSMIHTIHIKDCSNDYKYTELFGEGNGRFYYIAETLKKIGYTGWIVNENNYFKGEIAKQGDQLEMAKIDLEKLRTTFEN